MWHRATFQSSFLGSPLWPPDRTTLKTFPEFFWGGCRPVKVPNFQLCTNLDPGKNSTPCHQTSSLVRYYLSGRIQCFVWAEYFCRRNINILWEWQLTGANLFRIRLEYFCGRIFNILWEDEYFCGRKFYILWEKIEYFMGAGIFLWEQQEGKKRLIAARRMWACSLVLPSFLISTISRRWSRYSRYSRILRRCSRYLSLWNISNIVLHV